MNACFERIKEESIRKKRNDSHDNDEEEEEGDENGETESGTC